MNGNWARVGELNTENLGDLVENRIAALLIPDFATAEECNEFSAALDNAPLQYYTVGRPAGYVGMTFIQYMNNPKQDYFDNVAAASADVRSVTSRSFDPVSRFVELIEQKTDYRMSVAEEPGYGSYFAGIIRILSGGNNIHIDFAPQFAHDHVVGQVTAQLAWNVYIDQPPVGGKTTIWNRPWRRTGNAEEDAKYPEFTEEELESAEALVFEARAGSVMIFNARNPHQVATTPESKRLNRIGAGSFIGQAADRELILWS